MWRSWCAVAFALETTKRKPRRWKPSGRWKRLFAVRPMVEDEKADEKGDGQTSRKEIEIHCGLVAAFNFLDDDGADNKGDGDASC